MAEAEATADLNYRRNSVADLLAQAAATFSLDEPQATLQAATGGAITYGSDSIQNPHAFHDRNGFEGYALQFAEECKGMSELEAIEKRGADLVSMLYTYRSLARALPPVSGDEAHKKAMYAASYEVMHPYIERVKQLMYFRDEVVSKWCSNLQLVVRVEAKKKADPSAIPCEGLLVQLLRVLDVLVVLDNLKDTKACLNNDFSTYKRAVQHCRSDIRDAESVTQANALLGPFLASKESMLSALKNAVFKLPGADDTLTTMANTCIDCLEQGLYVLPAEKHRLLRGAAYTLWLLDGAPLGDRGGANAFKKINKARFGKFMKRSPVLPLYGDMHANLQHVLERCPNFGKSEAAEMLPHSSKEERASRESYDIVAALPGYRVRCAEFLGALQAELHRVAAAGGGDRCKLPRAEHTRLAQSLTQVVSRGCRLMCALNALLAEFIAYKCAHVYDICGVT